MCVSFATFLITCSAMLNEVVIAGILVLILIQTESFKFFITEYVIICKFFMYVFTLLRKFLFIPGLLSIFIMKGFYHFSGFFFLNQLTWSCHFFSFIVLMWCIRITDLYIVSLVHSWNNSHLVMLYTFSILRNLVANILLRILSIFCYAENLLL